MCSLLLLPTLMEYVQCGSHHHDEYIDLIVSVSNTYWERDGL
jgi:hypothetical protein